MAKRPSKHPPKFLTKLASTRPAKYLKRQFTRFKNWRKARVRPHKTFRRSYKEEYRRDVHTPGLLIHAMETFRLIWKLKRVFIPLILIIVASFVLLVGLMSEEFYKQFQDTINESGASLAGGDIGNFAKSGLLLFSTITTGGLDSGMDDVGFIFTVILFIITWMVTLYLLRHHYAGDKPRLRDALYNSLGPLVATLLIFILVFIQTIPVMLVAITYNAAVATGFLDTPFYALVYFIFAALMVLLSGYLLSSSLIALVAVTAPGLYPVAALSAASDLMSGRRTRLVIRLVWLLIVVALIFIIIGLPIIWLDLTLKESWAWLANVPVVPFALCLLTCFSFIYAATYLYMYYRWLIDYGEK